MAERQDAHVIAPAAHIGATVVDGGRAAAAGAVTPAAQHDAPEVGDGAMCSRSNLVGALRTRTRRDGSKLAETTPRLLGPRRILVFASGDIAAFHDARTKPNFSSISADSFPNLAKSI